MKPESETTKRVIWTAVALFLVLAILEWFPGRSWVAWIDLALLGEILAVVALLELIHTALSRAGWQRLVSWITVLLAALLVSGDMYAPYAWALALGLALLGGAGILAGSLRPAAPARELAGETVTAE